MLLDQYGGIIETFDMTSDGIAVIKREADVESVIEMNKALQREGDGYSSSREWQKVASIPVIVVEKLGRQLGIDLMAKENEAKLISILNDPEFAHFRTITGKI